MPRFLSILLILGLLLPSLSFASEPASHPLSEDDLLPTYFFSDEASIVFALSPLTEEVFIWSLWELPSSSYANPHAVTSATIIDGGGEQTLIFGYDPNGNLLTRSDNILHT